MSDYVGSSVSGATGSPGGAPKVGWSKKTLTIAAGLVLVAAVAAFFIGQGTRRSDSEAKTDIIAAKTSGIASAKKTVAEQKRQLKGASVRKVNSTYKKGVSKGYESGRTSGQAAAQAAVADARQRGVRDGYEQGWDAGLAVYRANQYTYNTYDPYDGY